mmetsp:Transcript_26452/g.49597  ORF Transcript_26452/g.49597 Transcript_26452/m.49597 type:complete len:88 (+) Transcript_26452:1557-1820(+)
MCDHNPNQLTALRAPLLALTTWRNTRFHRGKRIETISLFQFSVNHVIQVDEPPLWFSDDSASSHTELYTHPYRTHSHSNRSTMYQQI